MLVFRPISPPEHDPQVAGPLPSTGKVLRLNLVETRVMLQDLCERDTLIAQLNPV